MRVVITLSMVCACYSLKLTVIEQTLHTRHRPPPGQQHAECPDRLIAAKEALYSAYGDVVDGGKISWLRAMDSERTSPDDAVAVLKKVHDVEHLRTVVEMSKVGGGFDTDTYCAPGSWEAMLDGTRCWIDALGMAAESRGPVFALSRPAGHHATRRVAMGFGLVNFAAAAAAAALEATGSGDEESPTIAILDWDVHHGNGVAAIFADEPRVRYCSLHEAGGFPGTGIDEGDRGSAGNILNVPLEKGSGSDEYLAALREKALPFLMGSEQGGSESSSTGAENDGHSLPSVLLVCAGYDALEADPLATMGLEPCDYKKSVDMIVREFGFPRERIALGLEGGYCLDPDVGMPAGVVATCSALLEESSMT